MPTPTPLPPELTPQQQVMLEPDTTIVIQDDKPALVSIGNPLDQIMEAGSPAIILGNRVIPIYAGVGLSHLVWALLNLILSLAGVTLTIMIFIRYLSKIAFDFIDNRRAETHYETEEEAKKADRSRLLLIFLVPTLALISLILFILTQDMRLIMVMIDWWTPLHLALFVAALVSYIFAFRRRKDEVEDNEFHVNSEIHLK